MSDTDLQLLERYTREHDEDAFAEVVRRHLALVFSAALRQVCSPQLAEEVAQSVFSDLARNACRLAPDTILTAWLYRVTRCTAIDVVRRESRRQAREQIASELAAMNATDALHATPSGADANWSEIAPLLEEAMHTLDEPDRTAVLLRYFENKPLLEVGQVLGTTEEAARKRIGRAVERLRVFFSKHGVTVGASGLAVVISANAVQAVPAGLSASISIAAALAGKAMLTAGTTTATQAIAMTVLQKSLIAVTIVAAVGTGLYQATQASHLRHANQDLQQQAVPLTAQVRQLQGERDAVSNRLAALQEEVAGLKSGRDTTELLKLRGEVGALRQRLGSSNAAAGSPSGGMAKLMSDPSMKEYLQHAMKEKLQSLYSPFFDELKLTPEQRERFLQLQTERASQSLAKLSASSQRAPSPAAAGAPGSGSSPSFDEQLEALLGGPGYARLKDFNDEIPARSAITLLATHVEGNPLTDEQNVRLLQVIKAEPTELTSGLSGSPDAAFLGSQAQIDSFLQRVADSNQRILQQSATFLAPGQLEALNTVLTNAINTRKLAAGAFIHKP